MNNLALDFLRKNKIGVMSVILPDGNLHSATVHYSNSENPLKIYIQTLNNTLKYQPFINNQKGKGSFVVGFSEKEWLTLQIQGEIRAVSKEDEIKEVCKTHYKKYPEAEKYRGPNTVFLELTPTWWRYTDFNTDPETIFSS